MYASHRSLREPADGDRLWRYMDLERLLHLMEYRKLHFARLAGLQDPFEGHLPEKLMRDVIEWTLDHSGTLANHDRGRIAQDTAAAFSKVRDYVCASCWHVNKAESAAMWDLYARRSAGIAIATTFGNLKRALASSSLETHGGLVQYIDFDKWTRGTEANSFEWAVLKRVSFEHEREFRVLVIDHGAGTSGALVDVDLSDLILEAWLHPLASNWTLDLLQSIFARYEMQAPVRRSELLRPPNFEKLLAEFDIPD